MTEDGDQVDILILMDETAFAGCTLSAGPIGVIQDDQCTKKNKERNNRIVAVKKDGHSLAELKTTGNLRKQFCHELEKFFFNYHHQSGNSTA